MRKKEHISKLNEELRRFLSNYQNVTINSTDNSLPNVLNFSIKGIKPETFLHALESDDIFVSTKSACSSEDAMSKPVYAVTKDEDRANTSIRISLSSLTTESEINVFMESFDRQYKKLIEVSNENH